MTTSLDVTQLRTFHQVAEECPALSYNTLRYWYNNRHRNDFARCIVKILGRTFIDLDQLTVWVKDHRDHPSKHARGEAGR